MLTLAWNKGLLPLPRSNHRDCHSDDDDDHEDDADDDSSE